MYERRGEQGLAGPSVPEGTAAAVRFGIREGGWGRDILMKVGAATTIHRARVFFGPISGFPWIRTTQPDR
jgi:hypothetical protein